MYELSKIVEGHKRDLRALDYHKNVLVTGGSDKVFNMFAWKDGVQTLVASSDIFEKNILSVRINKVDPQAQIFVLVGCADGKVYAFDSHCNPVKEFEHNSSISSIDFIDKDHFVTGSWDGKGIVWSISDHKQVTQYTEHNYAVAVYYNKLSDTVVSGSQDKSLNVWNWRTGKKVKRLDGAHTDIIRQISEVEDIGFITCSNDQTVKVWSSDLELVESYAGHTAFVFSAKSFGLGHYVSGGDDRSIKVWRNGACQQTIQVPSSVWSITLDENKDILAGSSDGMLRTFTTSNQRRAPTQTIQLYQKEILQSASKKSGMSAEEINKLSTVQQMNAMKGKKEGQIRVFRNGLTPQAYMWQGGKWEKIGDVITQGNQGGSAQKGTIHYPGDKYFEEGDYDYVFDVDDESGVPKVIPFNDGANALESAERYCKREGLTKGYVEQIRKFLLQNSSTVPRQNKNKQESKQFDLSQLKCTPSMSIIEFNDVKNPPALLNKLKEFNEKAQDKKLSEKELGYLQRIVTQLESSNSYHLWKLDFKEMDTLKKLLTWPKPIRFPVWDLLRAFLKHYQSESLFSGLDAGFDIISQLAIGLETQHPEAIYTLILKTLSNILIQNTNKSALIQHYEILFQCITQISKRNDLNSVNFLYAFASFLFDYSIALVEKNTQNQTILAVFSEVLRVRLDKDNNKDNRALMLQAGANILSKYRETAAKNYQYLMNYLQNDDVSADVKLLLK